MEMEMTRCPILKSARFSTPLWILSGKSTIAHLVGGCPDVLRIRTRCILTRELPSGLDQCVCYDIYRIRSKMNSQPV